MKKNIVYFVLIIFLVIMYGCKDNEEIQEKIISVSNVTMQDLGQINPSSYFNLKENATSISCELRTPLIKTDDEIENVEVKLIGQVLRISIITTPNDFDCSDVSCFSTHLITFDLEKELIRGEYTIELGINHGYGKPFKYKVE